MERSEISSDGVALEENKPVEYATIGPNNNKLTFDEV